MTADPASLILAIPPAIAALQQLFSQSSDDTVRQEGSSHLEEIRRRVMAFAEQHFALRDWKLMHSALHDLQISFLSIDEFTPYLEPGETIPIPSPTLKAHWANFRRNDFQPFLDRCQDVTYISGLEVERRNYATGETIRVDVVQRLRELDSVAHRSLGQGIAGVKPASDSLQEFRDLVNEGIIGADGNIRRLAGQLADLSIELKARLES